MSNLSTPVAVAAAPQPGETKQYQKPLEVSFERDILPYNRDNRLLSTTIAQCLTNFRFDRSRRLFVNRDLFVLRVQIVGTLRSSPRRLQSAKRHVFFTLNDGTASCTVRCQEKVASLCSKDTDSPYVVIGTFDPLDWGKILDAPPSVLDAVIIRPVVNRHQLTYHRLCCELDDQRWRQKADMLREAQKNQPPSALDSLRRQRGKRPAQQYVDRSHSKRQKTKR